MGPARSGARRRASPRIGVAQRHHAIERRLRAQAARGQHLHTASLLDRHAPRRHGDRRNLQYIHLLARRDQFRKRRQGFSTIVARRREQVHVERVPPRERTADGQGFVVAAEAGLDGAVERMHRGSLRQPLAHHRGRAKFAVDKLARSSASIQGGGLVPFLIVLASLIALNAWMTRRVLRAPQQYLHNKRMLVPGIWIIPFMGALLARDQLRAYVPAEATPAESEAGVRPLEAREPAPQHVSAAGVADFELAPHIAHSSGFPWLDWEAVAAWVGSIDSDPPGARGQALAACRRAWLLQLRDALGPEFLLHESESALVLSSLEPNVVRATAGYVAKTRQRVAKLLGGLAHLPSDEKSILVVFDDEDSCYHYIGALYPADGEFAFSGGMFINAGCPHFVTRRADLAQIETVIAHELTHSAVSPLQLPLWLDEGIAVNTERKLTGVPHSIYTPPQMHAKHLQFWGEPEIHQFWSGESFHRPDDGQMLSYDLARILVENLAQRWDAFEAFVSHARRSDAGAQAASEHLDIDLGAAVCALLQREPSAAWAPVAAMDETPVTAARL